MSIVFWCVLIIEKEIALKSLLQTKKKKLHLHVRITTKKQTNRKKANIDYK